MFDYNATYYKFARDYPISFNRADSGTKARADAEHLYFTDIHNILAYVREGSLLCTIMVPEGAIVAQEGNKYKCDQLIIEETTKVNEFTIIHLISLGANIHAGEDGMLLHWAASLGYTKLIELLIKMGLDIRAANDLLLKTAAAKGNSEIVKLCISAGADVHSGQDTALRWAVECNQVDVARILIEAGSSEISPSVQEALIYACEYGMDDLVRVLIDAGVDVTADRNKPIREAAANGYANIVQLLIGAGADVRAWNDYALRRAAENGHLDVVLILIGAGADVATDDNCPLKYAAHDGHADVVRALIEAGADVNAALYELPALQAAGEEGHTEVVKTLIAAGANVNINNGRVFTELAGRGSPEVVRMLIDAGAFVTTRALIRAAEMNRRDIVRMLLEAGVNLHELTIENVRPIAYSNTFSIIIEAGGKDFTLHNDLLCEAAAQGEYDLVEALIHASADIHYNNHCALRAAAKALHYTVVKLLIEEGYECNHYSKRLAKAIKYDHPKLLRQIVNDVIALY